MKTTTNEPALTIDIRDFFGVPDCSPEAMAKLDAIQIELPKKSVKKGRK